MKEIKWERETDIVIIGAGTAGLPAAIEARKLGLGIIILDSMTDKQYHSSLAMITGGQALACTNYQKEQGEKDSLESYLEDAVKYTGGERALWEAFVSNSLSMYEGLLSVGVKPLALTGCPGHSARRIHVMKGGPILKGLQKRAEEVGAEILWEHSAKDLVKDPETGRISGVKAEHNGKEMYFKGKKGVLICTGGFGRNADLIKEFGPEYLVDAIPLMPESHTGDGLIMALRVGAATRGMRKAVAPSLATCTEKKVETNVMYTGAICVNKNGKRFINEDCWYGHLTERGAQQPDKLFYPVYDEKVRQYTKKLYPRFLNLREYKGDTIEELAGNVGIDAGGLRETLTKYNADIDTPGYDQEFGRKTLDGVTVPFPKIEVAPFYAMKCTVSITSFKGGLRVNAKSQVLDWSDKPIPGLYAAGECCGGFFGSGTYLVGTMTTIAMVTAQIAARNMAAEPG